MTASFKGRETTVTDNSTNKVIGSHGDDFFRFLGTDNRKDTKNTRDGMNFARTIRTTVIRCTDITERSDMNRVARSSFRITRTDDRTAINMDITTKDS